MNPTASPEATANPNNDKSQSNNGSMISLSLWGTFLGVFIMIATLGIQFSV